MSQAAAGDQDHIDRRGQEFLKFTKAFPKNALGPISGHGVSVALGGNDSKAAQGCFPLREQKKVKTKKSAFPSCSGEADPLKIRLRCNVLMRCKPHGAAREPQALSLCRPRARRARRTLRPPRVALRARKPKRRARFKQEGL